MNNSMSAGTSVDTNNRRSFLVSEINSLKESTEECDAVYKSLEELPITLRKKVMVPLGQVAFVPGIIDRTNEIFVHLGADHFAWRSSFQAREILERRKKRLEENITELENRLENEDKIKTNAPESETVVEDQDGGDETVNIREPYDEGLASAETSKPKVSTFTPLSSEKQAKIMARLEELERLEQSGSDFEAVVTSPGDEMVKAQDSGQAFSGTITERRNIETRKETTENDQKPKKKVSLFKQRMMNK